VGAPVEPLLRSPVRTLSPRNEKDPKKGSYPTCGGGGIRTLGDLRLTAFRVPRTRPGYATPPVCLVECNCLGHQENPPFRWSRDWWFTLVARSAQLKFAEREGDRRFAPLLATLWLLGEPALRAQFKSPRPEVEKTPQREPPLLAEREGFEPSETCASRRFQHRALDRTMRPLR
jgi:hypothetical protein